MGIKHSFGIRGLKSPSKEWERPDLVAELYEKILAELFDHQLNVSHSQKVPFHGACVVR